jgi:hypothetical protein
MASESAHIEKQGQNNNEIKEQYKKAFEEYQRKCIERRKKEGELDPEKYKIQEEIADFARKHPNMSIRQFLTSIKTSKIVYDFVNNGGYYR